MQLYSRKIPIKPVDREMFVDTGRHTGFAVFENDQKAGVDFNPATGGFTSRDTDLYAYLDTMARILLDALSTYKPDRVWLESAEFWGEESEVSEQAVKQWDLFKLQTMVGVYYAVMRSCKIECRLIFAREWKGQLTKDATKKRVFRATGKYYPNDHITDAVGMGLSIYGQL